MPLQKPRVDMEIVLPQQDLRIGAGEKLPLPVEDGLDLPAIPALPGLALPRVPASMDKDPAELKDEPLGEMREIISHAFELKVEDNYKDRGVTEVHLWTLDQKNSPHLLRIQDAPIFCHMELPQIIDGRLVQWTHDSAGRLVSQLARMLGDDAPTKWDFSMKPKIYYYRGDRKFPMLLLMFKTVSAMYHCQNLTNKPRKYNEFGTMRLDCWETSISTIRKIFSLRDCRYSQWFRIKGQEVPLDHEMREAVPGANGNPIREFIVHWKTLDPVSADESKGWTTNPRLLAFDIETYSDNHRAMPNQFNAKHKAYMVSCVYQRLGDPKSRRKYAIIIGDCDEIEGCEVIRVKDEVELVETIGRIVQELDPEIVTGYNILAYDYPYLDVRLKTKMRDWPFMGRLQGRRPVMTTKTWKSSAYGHNSINMLQMDGRISIDMLPIVRRDFKLDKYDLDFVCKDFLGRGKHPVKAQEMFAIFERLEKAQAAVDSQLNALPPERRAAIKEYRVAMRAKADLMKGLLKRVADAKDRVDAEQQEGMVSREAEEELVAAKQQMTRVMAYCVEDSTLVIDLFEKLNVWIGLVELSSIVGVTITDLFTRGQQIRCQSQIYNLASVWGYVLDKRQAAKLFFNGGFVFEPKPGIYDNIICLDFKSLYPSIMEAYNICFTTLVPPESMDQVPDALCNVIEFDQEETPSGLPRTRGGSAEEDEGLIPGVNDEEGGDDDDEESPKTVKRHYKFKFVKPSVRKGILPQLVHDLVKERNLVRKQMKVIDGQSKTLDKLSAATKEKTMQQVLVNFGAEMEALKGRLSANASAEVKLAQAAIDEAVNRIKQLEDWVKYLNQFDPSIDMSRVIATMKEAIGSFALQLVVLEKRQLALKVSANSMFGFLGAQNGGLMALIEGAMCITAMGRQLIAAVNDLIRTKYKGDIVYGDTDSSMADLHIKDSKDCDRIGNGLAAEINGVEAKTLPDGTVIPAVPGLFPPPLAVEFEKAMRLLCIKKKKYAAYLINRDGSFMKNKKTGETEIMKKGIVLARRDNCAWLRETYMMLLRCVLDRAPIEQSYAILTKEIARLLRGQVQAKGNLTVIRELGADYKNSNYFMKVFSDELRRMGKPVNSGDRLEYVVVRTDREVSTGQEVPLGMKMRAIEMWEDAQEEAKKPKPAKPQVVQVAPAPVAAAPVSAPKSSRLKVVNAEQPPSPPKEETPVYPAENIDYLYYIEHILMNAIDQLFGVGYMAILPKYESIGYKPQHSRCHYASIQTPVKMIGKMITDLLRGYSQYSNPESEKLALIADTIEALPKWFSTRRTEVDVAAAAAEAARPRSRLNVMAPIAA